MISKITPRQKKHVVRLMEDAFDNTNTDKDGVQRLVKSSGKFKEAIEKTIRRFTAKAPDFTLARTILGDDFISPEEITAARGLTYTDEQIAELEQTLPSQEVLEWLRDNDFYLTAGSPSDMSLLDIRELERRYFYSKEGGWYSEPSEAFARNDKVTCRWLMLRKGPMPNSMSKTWSEQDQLISDIEVVPNAAEQVWGMTVYKAVRDIYLLPDVYVRTSSVGSDGDHVYVGCFDGGGFGVDRWDDDNRGGRIGVSSARKF